MEGFTHPNPITAFHHYICMGHFQMEPSGPEQKTTFAFVPGTIGVDKPPRHAFHGIFGWLPVQWIRNRNIFINGNLFQNLYKCSPLFRRIHCAMNQKGFLSCTSNVKNNVSASLSESLFYLMVALRQQVRSPVLVWQRKCPMPIVVWGLDAKRTCYCCWKWCFVHPHISRISDEKEHDVLFQNAVFVGFIRLFDKKEHDVLF